MITLTKVALCDLEILKNVPEFNLVHELKRSRKKGSVLGGCSTTMERFSPQRPKTHNSSKTFEHGWALSG